MVRKTLVMGIAFILMVSLLSVSLMTSFSHDAEAHNYWQCGWVVTNCKKVGNTIKCDIVGPLYCHTPH